MAFIAPIDVRFAAATAAIEIDDFEYQSGVPGELNLNDNPEKAKVYWELPDNGREKKRIKAGDRQRVVFTIYFLKHFKFQASQAEATPIQDAMDTASEQFMAALEVDEALGANILTEHRSLIYDEFDANMYGVALILTMEYYSEC